jgi:uncharacterized protein (TIGR02145 family)
MTIKKSIWWIWIVLSISLQVSGQALITGSDSIPVGSNTKVILRIPKHRGEVVWQQSLDGKNWITTKLINQDTISVDLWFDAWYRAVIREGTCLPVLSETVKVSTTGDAKTSVEKTRVEMAYPGQQGEVVKLVLNNDTLYCELINGKYVFQGDMILSPELFQNEPKLKGAGISPSYRLGKLWPDNTVYYTINSNITYNTIITPSFIREAIQEVERQTNLIFVQRTNQPNYVEFVWHPEACSSPVGMLTGRGEITIANWAIKGVVMHEIGHTIGLLHEHSRPDRDNFIDVDISNIKLKYEHNYYLTVHAETSGDLDIKSLMMYPSEIEDTTWLIDPSKIEAQLKTKKGITWDAQRDEFKPGDIAIINQLYPSSIKVTTTNYSNLTHNGVKISYNCQRVGTRLTAHGICWNTTGNPTLNGEHMLNGSGEGDFIADLAGRLLPERTYYVRAYAFNQKGVLQYSDNQLTFKTLPAPVVIKPAVTTYAVSSLAQTSAQLNGNITANGSPAITERGFYWSSTNVNPGPATGGTKVIVPGTTGIFSHMLTGLQPGQPCYFTAYAKTGMESTTGTVKSFTTLTAQVVAKPTVSTLAESSLSKTSAILNGNVSADGGTIVTERGFYWSNTIVNPGPQTGGLRVVLNGTTGPFSYSLSGMSPGQTVYYTAYAKNSQGFGSGTARSFKTLSDIVVSRPGVVTLAESAVSQTSAVLNGSVTSDGGASVTERGFYWSATNSNPGPSTGGTRVTVTGTTGNFSYTLSGLQSGKLYYFTAFASNSQGSSAGGTMSFKTASPQIAKPTVTTRENLEISDFFAIGGGEVVADGGAAVTARGVCWSRTQNPDIYGNKTTDGTGVGVFTSRMTGLTSKTAYYVRAYATNSAGTSYGKEVYFVTSLLQSPPTLTTTAISNITQSSATSGGNITSDGQAAITARGVCWSTSPNPTTANSKTSNGTGTGSFTSNITGLTANTTYYVRAYATNLVGTAYGGQLSFTTGQTTSTPVVTTAPVTNVTQNSATCGGNVTSDGGSTVTARGVCWSTSPNPTITGSKTTNGTGTGSFTSSITGLTANTAYFVRAYATNGQGTSYGSQDTLKTLPVSNLTGTFTDSRDNKTYKWVKIGDQTWMAENLAYLPSVSPSSQGSNTAPYYYVWGYHGTDVTAAKATDNYNTYGALYNWPAAMAGAAGSSANPSGVQGICPSGWHLPSDAEWKQLEMALGMTQAQADGTGWRGTDQGTQMKTTSGWYNNGNGTNSSGFSGIPSGYRIIYGNFIENKVSSLLWSSTDYSANDAWFHALRYEEIKVNRQYTPKETGISVRCVRNENQQVTKPTLTTVAPSDITSVSAKSGGDISSDGGSPVTSRGVVWSVVSNPTVESNQGKTADGSGTGKFASSIQGLSPKTVYYIRAYATNSAGTEYGNQLTLTTSESSGSATGTFTDSRDNKTYKWVKIGDQTWMAENLAYLPSVSPSSQGSLTLPYYYVYGYEGTDVNAAKSNERYNTYGVLYNWPAVMAGQEGSNSNPSGVRGICPEGWHIPSMAEWEQLENYLIANGYNYDGTTTGNKIAKSLAAQTNWDARSITGVPGNDMGSNNTSGFNGLPSGYRGASGGFSNIGFQAHWWTSTQTTSTGGANVRWLSASAFELGISGHSNANGHGLRCVK